MHIGEMAKATIKMVMDSVDAFVKRDLDAAQAVVAYDDVVDQLFDTVKNELIELIASGHADAEYAVDLLMIAKYFERIGDHAANIAEWVEFSITGIHKKLQPEGFSVRRSKGKKNKKDNFSYWFCLIGYRYKNAP